MPQSEKGSFRKRLQKVGSQLEAQAEAERIARKQKETEAEENKKKPWDWEIVKSGNATLLKMRDIANSPELGEAIAFYKELMGAQKKKKTKIKYDSSAGKIQITTLIREYSPSEAEYGHGTPASYWIMIIQFRKAKEERRSYGMGRSLEYKGVNAPKGIGIEVIYDSETEFLSENKRGKVFTSLNDVLNDIAARCLAESK